MAAERNIRPHCLEKMPYYMKINANIAGLLLLGRSSFVSGQNVTHENMCFLGPLTVPFRASRRAPDLRAKTLCGHAMAH
jgi:hypothetical protein